MSQEFRSTDEPAGDGARGDSEAADMAEGLFLQLGPRVLKQSAPLVVDSLAETLIASQQVATSTDAAFELVVARLPSRYEYKRVLGRGGQGHVILAWESNEKRDVAIKLLINSHERDIGLLRKECETLAQFEYPGIVGLLHFGELQAPRQGGEPLAHALCSECHQPIGAGESAEKSVISPVTPFLVLEYVPGGTLREYVFGQQRSVAEIVGIVTKVAAAVGEAHKLKIVHRDLKPSNVLMTAAGEPKVLDFGLAQDERSRQSQNLGGTLSYMSPEQSQAKPTVARTDVYSLGVTLYELLTGTFPKELTGSDSEKLRCIRDQPPIPLRNRDTTLPRELEDICDKCLRTNPTERYSNASDLSADLNRYLKHQPIDAWRGWRWPYVVRNFVRRHRVSTGLVLVIVAITMISFRSLAIERNEAIRLTGVAQENESRADKQSRLATKNAERAEHHRVLAEVARDESESRRFRLLVDSADRAIAARQFHDARMALLEAESRGTTWETARLTFEAGAERFTSQRLAEHHWGLTTAVLSPDRSRLVSAAADGALLVWDMQTGRVGQTLAAGELRADGRLRRHCAVSATGELLTEPSSFVTGLCWLGDSDRFVAASFDGSARVHSLTQPEVRTLRGCDFF